MNNDIYFQLTQFNARYAAVINNQDWDKWPEFFVDDCQYKVQPRENFERGFPLCTLNFISKGMLKDRVYGIKETLFHDPYYQRHVIGTPLILNHDSDVIEAETNYAVFRTKASQETTVFNVGRYIDTLKMTSQGIKIVSRNCVYDSEMIPNSLIYPI